jgi:hypothetical protein
VYTITEIVIVGSNPSSGKEFSVGAWFIPHTETGIDVITIYNLIITFKKTVLAVKAIKTQ